MLVAYATNCPLADMQKAVGYDELSSANARENASEGEARVYMRTVPSCMTGCSCHAAAADATKPSSLRRREVRAWGEARVGGGGTQGALLRVLSSCECCCFLLCRRPHHHQHQPPLPPPPPPPPPHAASKRFAHSRVPKRIIQHNGGRRGVCVHCNHTCVLRCGVAG